MPDSIRDIPEDRQYTLEELTLSPAERERFEVRGLLMAAIHDGLDGAITGQVSDRGVERCADHILREWVPRLLAGRSRPIRDIPEEMVENATIAVADVAGEITAGGREATARAYAIAALSAAVAGRTLVALPDDAEDQIQDEIIRVGSGAEVPAVMALLKSWRMGTGGGQ